MIRLGKTSRNILTETMRSNLATKQEVVVLNPQITPITQIRRPFR